MLFRSIGCALIACIPASTFAAVFTPAARAQAPLHVLDGLDYASVDGGFGGTLAPLGDVDRDGYDDFAVGAPGEAVGHVDYVGRVRVISGRDRSVIRTHEGYAYWSLFGYALAAAGDVDRDGWVDLLVGAPTDDFQGTNSGAAWLYSGRDGALLFLLLGSGVAAQFGSALGGAGDVNGDSFPDLVVGAPGLGYVDVISGRDGSLVYRVNGTGGNTRFGNAVCGAGDLDLDGLDDIVVGETATQNGGLVHAYMGPTASKSLTISDPGAAYFGTALSRVGDLTGDQRAEIVIGTAGHFSTSSAYVWDTASNSFHFEVSWTSVNHSASFGSSVAGPGDIDGDGVPDFAVGAPSDLTVPGPGSAFLYSGADGSLLQRFINLGDTGCCSFGSSLSAAGDVNGDGRLDLLIGSPHDKPLTLPCQQSPWYGRALVFSLSCPAPTIFCTAKVNSQGCTPSIGSNGTPSLGGPDDFIVTADNVVNNKSGLLLWSLAQKSAPFQGGTLCLAPPIRRTSVQTSGGNPPPNDCSGTFQFHFSQAYMLQNVLEPGSRVFAQYWYRDPPSSSGSGLTDALGWITCY